MTVEDLLTEINAVVEDKPHVLKYEIRVFKVDRSGNMQYHPINSTHHENENEHFVLEVTT